RNARIRCTGASLAVATVRDIALGNRYPFGSARHAASTRMSAPFRFGPFFLDSRIAVGGTAEVYLGRPATPDSGLPEHLVVKRLLPHFASDPEGRTMFEREARLHAAVTHDNVVTVFGAGTEPRGDTACA